MERTKMIALSRIVLLVVALSCSFASAEEPVANSAKVKLGAILTMSGSFASVGEDCRRGIEAAMDVADARNSIEVVYADSKNESTSAISELRKLSEIDNVQAVYTHRSTIGMALNPVSQTLQMPLLGAVAHKSFAVDNIFAFQIWSTSDEEGDFLVSQIRRLNYKKIAILSTEDDWTLAVSERFRSGLSTAGVEVIFDQSVQPSETDFKSLIIRLKHSSPDAIFMNVVLPQISPFVKQFHQASMTTALFSNIYVAKKDVLEATGADALEGIRFVEIDTELPSLNKQIGLDLKLSPPGLTVASYLATLLLAQTVKENGNIRSTKDMYAALLRQNRLRTPDHEYLVKDRFVKFPLALKVMRGGKPNKEQGYNNFGNGSFAPLQ
jgi:branched-chain amino acid transport system substrate-binding protein